MEFGFPFASVLWIRGTAVAAVLVPCVLLLGEGLTGAVLFQACNGHPVGCGLFLEVFNVRLNLVEDSILQVVHVHFPCSSEFGVELFIEQLGDVSEGSHGDWWWGRS